MEVRSLCCVFSCVLFFSHFGFSQDQRVICEEKLEALINVNEVKCEEGGCPYFIRENSKNEVLQALYSKERVMEFTALVKERGATSAHILPFGKYLYYGEKKDLEKKNKFVNIKLRSLVENDTLSFFGRAPASRVVLKKEKMEEFFRSLTEGIAAHVFRSDLEGVSFDDTILLAAPDHDLIRPPAVKPEKPPRGSSTILMAAPDHDLIRPPAVKPREPASDDIKKVISDRNYDEVVVGTTVEGNEVQSLCKAGYMMPECGE